MVLVINNLGNTDTVIEAKLRGNTEPDQGWDRFAKDLLAQLRKDSISSYNGRKLT